MKSRRDQVTFILIILGVMGAVAVIGFGVDTMFGSEWFSLLNIAVSAALTAALVILYFRQSTILESQRELLEAEMNRGVREQHTETLRERVREWHGNPDRETGETPTEGPTKNLPSVGRVSFTSAPNKNRVRFGSGEDEFRVMSIDLMKDRYMQDLLENHAHDLKNQVERLEFLQQQFDRRRQEFCDKFDYGLETQCGPFSTEPDEYLSRWFFDQLIRLERGYTEDWRELRVQMVNQIGSLAPEHEEGSLWMGAEVSSSKTRPIYLIHYNEAEVPDWREHQSKLEDEICDVIQEVSSEVEHDYPFESVRRAAARLDQGAIAVQELDRILIEYDGKPIYRGECEYLQEARIQPSSD